MVYMKRILWFISSQRKYVTPSLTKGQIFKSKLEGLAAEKSRQKRLYCLIWAWVVDEQPGVAEMEYTMGGPDCSIW